MDMGNKNRRIRSAFCSAGEPKDEPEYMGICHRLSATLDDDQDEMLLELLTRFGELVQFERQWYFQKGWNAAKKDTDAKTPPDG